MHDVADFGQRAQHGRRRGRLGAARVRGRGFVGQGDAEGAADRAQMAAQTGVSPEDAGKRVDQAIADAKAAEVKAQQGVDAARKAGATMSIFTGLAMLIGAFIACVAAALGGQQRDEHA